VKQENYPASRQQAQAGLCETPPLLPSTALDAPNGAGGLGVSNINITCNNLISITNNTNKYSYDVGGVSSVGVVGTVNSAPGVNTPNGVPTSVNGVASAVGSSGRSNLSSSADSATTPPVFTEMDGNNINPVLTFNSKRLPFKRYATHAAIAFYIYFDQRHQAGYNAKQQPPLDPTLAARMLKVHSYPILLLVFFCILFFFLSSLIHKLIFYRTKR